LQALNNAVALRNPPQGCIHHTDRGSQGRFKRPSQHLHSTILQGIGRGLRREFSSQGSSEVLC
jgi:hypothetical protein